MSRAVAEANYRKKQEEERKRKQAEEQKQASASSRQRTENRQAARQTLADRNRGTQQRATEAYINRTNTQKQSTFFDRDTASTYKANRNNKRDNNWNQNKTRNQFLERDTANFETKKAPQGSQTHRNVPTESQASSVHGGGGGGFKESSTAEKIARKTGKVVDETLRNTVTSDLITATDIGQENKWRQRSVDVNANNENIQPLQKDVERAKKAGEDYQKLLKKRDESDKRLDELTKDAKGIEKAWYGAVEAGTGMGLDLAFGPVALAHMATRTYGSTRGKAQAQGATEAEDRLYSFAQAGKEVGTELIFPGAGIAKKVVGGRGLKIADRAVNALTKNLSGRKADIIGAGARLLAGTGEENIEEALGWGLDPIIEEYTYARNVRKRENQQFLQDQRSALLDSITDENSARSASMYLSSSNYLSDTAKEYEKAGVSKDKAIDLARKNKAYLQAALMGDTEKASQLEDEIASALSANHQMDWDKGELLETFGSTTMLTLLTGAGGAVSEARAGNSIKSQLGEEGTKELVELAKGFEDNELSIKAQVASDRLQEGKEITAIQAVELQRGAMEQVAKLADRKTASDRTAERQIERNEYVAPCARDDRGNLVMDDATEQAYQEAQESALKSITAKGTLSKKQSTAGANAIAGFDTGVFTVDNALELGYGNDTVREAFRERTGIDLDQYIVRDKNGNVDIPKTNAATYDALFAMSADNLVKSAERSTQVWIDKGRGEFSSTITQRMNADGVTAFREVMQDSDPRNRDEYVLKANVADLMYQQGKNLGLAWDEVKGDARDIAPNFDEGMLEKMYEAGRFDREREMDIARDEELVIGQALESSGMGRKPVKGNLSVEINNPENTPEDSVIGAFASLASSLGVDIHLVDSIQSQDGTEVYTNGYYTPDGDIVIHVASGGETNVGFIFMHEATHHLKKYAPTQYRELVDLVRQKWFSKDSEGMKKRINDTIALYATAGETLTEDQALEEIIANSAHEFLTDKNFAKEVAESNPELAKSLISAIKHVLRKLRQAIAGSYTNDTYMDSLFSELGILSEAERLWMNAYKAAVENKAAVGLVEWGKETRLSALNNTNPREVTENNTRFLLTSPMERVKDLIAIHNLKEDDLRGAFELGGFPMPSIAITKDSMGHDKYGDISLVFGSDTIDPKAYRTNQVFGGDAYTPTFPAIRFKPNKDVSDRISDVYYENTKKIGYDAMRPMYALAEDIENQLNNEGGEAGLKERYKSKTDLMRTFLKMNNQDVDDVVSRTETTLSDTEEKLRKHFINALGEDAIREFEAKDIPNGKGKGDFRRQWTQDHLDEIKKAYKDFLQSGSFTFTDEQVNNVISNMKLIDFMKLIRNALDYMNNGSTTVKEEVDRKATEQLIEEKAKENGYDKWIDDLLTGIEEKKGIRNNKEYFTYSGNRRSWETLHDEVTLDNVVRIMRTELAAGGNGFLWKNPKGAAQKEYKSLNDIRADEDRLQMLSDEEYKELNEAASQKLSVVCSSIVEHNPGRFSSPFGAILDVGEYIAEILNKTKQKDGIKRMLTKEYHLKVTDKEMDDLMDAINEIANLPTGYFEAKPRRAVGIDEVQAAIVPNMIDSELENALTDYGVNVYKYDPNDEGDRASKLNQALDEKQLRFSISPMDSDGNKLTDNQRAYFSNSKVTDKDGNLMVMYHGTPNGGFTIFNPGTYFTPNKEYADVYQYPGASSIGVKKEASSPDTYKVYLNITKPFDTRNPEERRIFEKEFYRKWGTGTPLAESGLPDWIDGMDLQEFLEEKGYDYDGLILDEGAVGGYGEEVKSRGLSYVIFEKSQVKDVNNENPTNNPDIRFSMTPKDQVMEQISDEAKNTDDVPMEDAYDEEGRQRYARSKDDFFNNMNAKWQERWKTEGKVLRTESIEKDVRQIVLSAMLNSDTSARYKTDMVKQTVQACRQAYRYLKEDKYDDAWNILYENALDMVENLEFVEDNLFKQYNPLRNYLRTTAFVVSEEYWQDEDFKDFVKRNRGRILIKHGEMSNVDSKFEELAEMYPEFFNSEAITNIEDQLAHIEDVLDKLQPYTWAYNSEEAMDLAQSLASNLADLILTQGEEYKSLADKYSERYDAQTKAMKVRHQEAISQIKERAEHDLKEQKINADFEHGWLQQNMDYSLAYQKHQLDVQHEEEKARLNERNERTKEKLANTREKLKQAKHDIKERTVVEDWMIAWLKQNRDISIAWAVHNEKQKQTAKREKEKQKQKERAIQKRQFRDIQESVGWLSEALLRPTKEQNIPEGFRAALARVLATIDLQTERSKKLEAKYGKVAKKTLALGRLRDEYKRISLSKDAVYNPRSYLVNEDNYGLMDDLALNCDGRSIDELNAEELESVDTMLKVLVNEFKSANEIRKAKKKATAMETASQGIADFKRTVKKRGLAKEYKGLRGGLDSILNYHELTPVYFFSRLGGTMQNMYGMLRDGFDTYVKNLAQINEDLSNIMYQYSKHGRFGGTTIEDWRNSKTAETIPLTNGGQVVLSAAQRMSIYCLAQRNQALVHMVYGGIRINPIQPGSKAEAFKERVSGVKSDRGAYTLSYEDIENIIAKLTPEQKKVADDLQMYMANQMAEMGNKTSLEDLGIKVFKDKNYFPIHVSGENLETRIDKVDAIVNWISNPGFMKALMPNSKKPIDIDDIFTVTAQHCNSMNLYASYAVPLADFMKVFNAEVVNADGTKTSFKEELIKAHGDKALTYVTNFLKDINGSMTKRKGGEVLESLIGKAKKAAVFANIRVLLQQPMSLFRSWQLINPKYFGVIPWTPSSMREMIENCPIAQWKSWGYYDTHFGRDIEDVLMNVKPGLMDIVGGGLYGYADLATWTYIWNAVKAEQRDYFERRKRRGTDYTEEEFLQACNERASEVFDKTQVVDSLFHRSDWMRSDQVYIKQLTSFQAEPTVSFNMLRAGLVEMADALRDGDIDKGMAILARTTSTYLLNAAAVGAMAAIADVFRGKGQADDDDEQLTAKELWYKNFIENFIQNAGVWNNIYLVKDTIVPAMDGVLGYIKDGNWYSGLENNIAFQGFKNIQSGLKKAWNIYTKGEDSNYNALDVVQEVAGGLGLFYGIPARTVIRDSRRLWNLFAENAYAADPYTFTVTLNNGQEVVTNDYREHIKHVAQYTESGEMRSQSVTQPEGSAARAFFTGLGYEDKSIKGYNDPTKTEETDERFGLIQAFDSWVDGLGAKYRENKAAEKEAEKEEKKKLKDAKKLVNGETSKRKPAFADLSDSEKIDRLNEDLEGVTGEKRSKKIWDKINDGYGDKVEEGDYAYVRRMRAIMEGAGGDLEFFDEKILDKSKTAFKKSLVYDPNIYQQERQNSIRDYLLNHGMTEEEISANLIYGTDMSDDLKAAFRTGSEENILEVLRPLIQAGITFEDFKRIYDNRNLGLKNYKGRFKDELEKISSGKLVSPCNGTITSGFGYRKAPTRGASTYHKAIDIAGNMGDPIAAADGGEVVYAGWYGGYGYQVRIRHPNGTETRYSHLRGYNVKVGDIVRQGQNIAQMGSTGTSTGPHLDFQVKVQGRFVDPLKYING